MALRKKICISEHIPFQAYAAVLLTTCGIMSGRYGMQGGTLWASVCIYSLALTYPVVRTGAYADSEHVTELASRERKERLERYCKWSAYLKAHIEDCRAPVHVGLGNLPRLSVRNVFVAHTRNAHSILESLTEMIPVKILLHSGLKRRYLGQGSPVNVKKLSSGRNLSSEIFVGQHHGAVHEISEYGHELAVVACLEIFPWEVIVLGFRCIGGQHITENILFSRELLQIFMRPHGPVARGRDFVPLQIEELVGRNILRKYITVTICLEHGREDDAMEDDVVLADEMHQLRILALPPFLPWLRQKFLCIGNIADRCIEPHIEDFPFCAFHRHRHSPVKVTAYGTRLKPSVNPALALAIDIASPLLVRIQNPLRKPSLVFIERKIPVSGLFLDRLRAAELWLRIEQLFRAEGASAFLTLVTICSFSAAFRASTHNIPVGKESLCLRVIILLAFFRYEFAPVIEFAEKFGGILLMDLRRGAAVYVEIDSETGKRILDDSVILVNHILRSAALLAGLYRNRNSVFIRSADIEDILPFQPEISDINVGRDIHACQMPDMHWTVGVWKRAGHKRAAMFFFHKYLNLNIVICQGWDFFIRAQK